MMCEKCGTHGLSQRPSKFGGTFLAYVEEYPNGAKYFRGTHTKELCDQDRKRRENDQKNEKAYLVAMARYELEADAWRSRGKDLQERTTAHIAAGGVFEDFAEEHKAMWDSMPVTPKPSDFANR